MNENTAKEKKQKPKGSIIFGLFSLFFCVMLGFFTLYGFYVPDREMSENENRVLAGMPELTLSGVLDGSFMKDFETYLSDQFPFRDEAIYIKSFTDRLWGKKQENGVYIGKDGFLFDEPASYSKNKMKALAEKINALSEKNSKLNTVFALVPNSSYIYSDKLPDYLVLPDQKKQIKDFYSRLDESIKTVNTVSPLLKVKETGDAFYRTDHHWTTRGAYSVFLKTASKLGINTKGIKYEFHTVSTHFEGTLKSKSLSQKAKDRLEVCFPENSQGTYYIEFSGTPKKRASLFFEEKLKEKNKYEVFLGGNYAKVTVTTDLLDYSKMPVVEASYMSYLPESRKLLVVKDSYANCMIPMLTPYFTKIVIVDPRYMTENLHQVLNDDDFTDLLFLYNANTLFSDSSLATVL